MNRRSFINTSVGAAAYVTLGAAASACSQMPPLHKKSLKFGMIQEEISVLEKFRLVQSLGFDGIELDSPNDLLEAEILEARDKTGLAIPGVVNSVHWKKPMSHPDPAVSRKECTDSMIDALHKCKLYGGTTVLLVTCEWSMKTVRYDEAWERSTARDQKNTARC